MNIGHFFNIANLGYNYVRFLRTAGYEAQLVTDRSDYIMAHPQWEEQDFELGNHALYGTEWHGSWAPPAWVKYIDLKPKAQSDMVIQKTRRVSEVARGLLSKREIPVYSVMISGINSGRHSLQHIHRLASSAERWSTSGLSVVRAMREYDVLHTWWEGAAYARFSRVPYLAHPAGGDLTIIPFEKTLRGGLQLEGYRRAKYVIIGSAPLLEFANRLHLRNIYRMKTMVDTEKYKPGETRVRDKLKERFRSCFLIFSPARQDWFWKGSDKLIRAFSRLVKEDEERNCLLLLTDWGIDVGKSKELVSKLELGDNVMFTPLMAKKRLIEYYRASDLVVDSLGTYGYIDMSMLEAMSCGKPVMMYLSREKYEAYDEQMPPVLNASTKDDVHSELVALAGDQTLRQRIGSESRDYVVKNHGWQNLVGELVELYEQVAR